MRAREQEKDSKTWPSGPERYLFLARGRTGV